MSQSILISSPDHKWSQDLKDFLLKSGHQCLVALTGKDCQTMVHKTKFNLILLDVDTSNHSGMEVLKFLKITCPSLKVLLCFQNKNRSQELNFDSKTLSKLGVCKTFIRPFLPQVFLQYLEEIKSPGQWKDLQVKDYSAIEENENKIADIDCTKLNIETFLSGNISIFDFYIRIGPNRYVKILREGEGFDAERINKYVATGVKYFYFLNKDRLTYINFMNEITKKTLGSHKPIDAIKTMSHMRNISDKCIEEVYTKGLNENIVEESKVISQNMYALMKKNDALKTILNNYMDMDPASYSHIFLVSFFTTLICKSLPWVGPKTRETVILGSFLHDIGMLKIPAKIRDLPRIELVAKDLVIYKQHPQLGADMLLGIPGISQQVIQIVQQHHENTTGSGFPNGLSAMKIFPLAKIVSLADEFSHILIQNKSTPREGLKLLLQDREKVIHFDSSILRALANGFIQEK